MERSRFRTILNYMFFTIQLLVFILLIINNKYHYIFSIVVSTLGFMFYLYLEKKYKLIISNYIILGLMAAIIIHHIFGEYLNLYVNSVVFDKVLHIFGTYVFTTFVYLIITQQIRITFTTKIGQFIFVVLLGISIGVFYEIAEFALDMYSKPKIPYQKNLVDTDLDIISDIIGSLLAAFHATNQYKLVPPIK